MITIRRLIRKENLSIIYEEIRENFEIDMGQFNFTLAFKDKTGPVWTLTFEQQKVHLLIFSLKSTIRNIHPVLRGPL